MPRTLRIYNSKVFLSFESVSAFMIYNKDYVFMQSGKTRPVHGQATSKEVSLILQSRMNPGS